MSESRKLNLGPLPEPVEDIQKFEETEILWGRVIAFAAVTVLLVSAILAWVMGDATDEAMISTSPMPALVLSDSEQREPPLEVVPEVKDGEAVTVAPQDGIEPADAKNGEVESVVQAPEASAASVISPVTTLHEGMRRAELTLSLKDGQPVAPLEYDVPMSAEGIIKVILFTEMKDLKGTTLFHDWYREEKRMARVKIPVNVSEQSSYSSKFINRQMTGEWTVKVADQRGELYAQANFRVE